ncbi:MAG TPA: preprotein translocase subunit YajC [Planctomycetales bacterium]|jgi:preprotein translocase subunit YajC|nr:preprotein translocase subunit YajC [Planctomycetales bacterium]
MFNTLMILLADAAGSGTPPAGGTPQGGGGLFDNPIIFLALPGIALFYILFLRPMRKQEQERAALLTAIKKNDKIITHSGIYGTVVSVSEKEDEIVVRVDDNVRLKMVKNSIMRNLTNEEAAKEAKAAKGAKDAKPAAAPASTAVTTKEGGA